MSTHSQPNKDVNPLSIYSRPNKDVNPLSSYSRPDIDALRLEFYIHFSSDYPAHVLPTVNHHHGR